MIYNVPVPDDDFPAWDFVLDEPKNKKTIDIIKQVKNKRHGRRDKLDTKLF